VVRRSGELRGEQLPKKLGDTRRGESSNDELQLKCEEESG